MWRKWGYSGAGALLVIALLLGGYVDNRRREMLEHAKAYVQTGELRELNAADDSIRFVRPLVPLGTLRGWYKSLDEDPSWDESTVTAMNRLSALYSRLSGGNSISPGT